MNASTFSNETLTATANAMNELQNEINLLKEQVKEEPYIEVAQRYLMEKFEMTQSEAEEVCSELLSGISEFDSQFKANVESEKVNLTEKLHQITADMDEEKRIEFLSSILTAFQVSQKAEMTNEQIAELQQSNAKHTEDELISDIEACFNGEVSLDNIANYINSNINTETIVHLSQQIGMNKEEYRFLSALMLYTAQREGKVKLSETDEPIPAQLIGSLACASIETITATGDLKEGKIDMALWQKILKWTLGALLGCALAYLALLAVVFVATTITSLILAIFGTGSIAVLAALVLSIYCSWDLSKFSFKFITDTLEVLSGTYDQYIEPFTVKIKNWANIVEAWAKSLFNKDEKKESGESVMENCNLDVSDNQEPIVPVQPAVVMA